MHVTKTQGDAVLTVPAAYPRKETEYLIRNNELLAACWISVSSRFSAAKIIQETVHTKIRDGGSASKDEWGE